MTDLLALTLLALGFSAVGLVVALAAGVPPAAPWLPTLLGIAPFAGLLTSGVCAFVLLALGVDARPVVVISAAFAVALVTWRLPAGRLSSPWTFRPPSRNPVLRAAEWVVLVAYLPVSAVVLRLAVASVPGWDGWAIWGVKAHALYLDGDLRGPVLLDPFYVGTQQSYPLLQPALDATASGAIGRWEANLAGVVGVLALVFLGLAVWAILRSLTPGWVAAAVGLTAIGSWPLVVNATEGYADALLGAAVAFGLLCVTVFILTGSRVALELGLGALACSGLVKSEGLLFTVAAVIALAAAALVDRRTPLRSLVVPALVALVPGVAWAVLRGSRDEVVDTGELFAPGALWGDRSRATDAAMAMVDAIQTGWLPALAVGAGGLALALLGRRYGAAILVGVWVCCSFAGLVLVYVISRTEIVWHLATSTDRVVLSIGLVLAVVGPLLAVEGWMSVSGSPGPGAVETTVTLLDPSQG